MNASKKSNHTNEYGVLIAYKLIYYSDTVIYTWRTKPEAEHSKWNKDLYVKMVRMFVSQIVRTISLVMGGHACNTNYPVGAESFLQRTK
jgi:hypothetical protein